MLQLPDMTDSILCFPELVIELFLGFDFVSWNVLDLCTAIIWMLISWRAVPWPKLKVTSYLQRKLLSPEARLVGRWRLRRFAASVHLEISILDVDRTSISLFESSTKRSFWPKRQRSSTSSQWQHPPRIKLIHPQRPRRIQLTCHPNIFDIRQPISDHICWMLLPNRGSYFGNPVVWCIVHVMRWIIIYHTLFNKSFAHEWYSSYFWKALIICVCVLQFFFALGLLLSVSYLVEVLDGFVHFGCARLLVILVEVMMEALFTFHVIPLCFKWIGRRIYSNCWIWWFHHGGRVQSHCLLTFFIVVIVFRIQIIFHYLFVKSILFVHFNVQSSKSRTFKYLTISMLILIHDFWSLYFPKLIGKHVFIFWKSSIISTQLWFQSQ